MSEDHVPYNADQSKRLARIGALAVEWADAQDKFERVYTIDMAERRRLMVAAERALERLRIAALAYSATEKVAENVQ